MVVQYPHTLIATIVESSVQDEDGNWVPGGTTTREIKCRAEVKSPSIGGANLIRGMDGNMVAYYMTVYMPRGTQPIPFQTAITINCSPPVSGKVISFSVGQLNSRLWL